MLCTGGRQECGCGLKNTSTSACPAVDSHDSPLSSITLLCLSNKSTKLPVARYRNDYREYFIALPTIYASSIIREVQVCTKMQENVLFLGLGFCLLLSLPFKVKESLKKKRMCSGYFSSFDLCLKSVKKKRQSYF